MYPPLLWKSLVSPVLVKLHNVCMLQMYEIIEYSAKSFLQVTTIICAAIEVCKFNLLTYVRAVTNVILPFERLMLFVPISELHSTPLPLLPHCPWQERHCQYRVRPVEIPIQQINYCILATRNTNAELSEKYISIKIWLRKNLR